MLTGNSYNPDVLNCLANLSSDEVFTPPAMANRVLDLLPAEIWSDKNAKFLDPFCKSGVFLREIAKRLDVGLEKAIPDRQKRLNHIFRKQVYGLAITEITALLSRRSVYCSKTANGKYSVCESFEDEQGNIRFERTTHTWKDGRCTFCSASQEAYARGKELESHAYQLIHTENPKEIFKMKFDVIIGNPPYQMGSDGGTRDMPIYDKFVDQAKKLTPRFLSMIIPSRWMAGGLGLSDFRRRMLEDRRVRKLVDYPMTSEVFPGVQVKGGICYFLWERDTEGDCVVTTVRGNNVVGPVDRNLGEYDIFIRDSGALRILHKVISRKEPPLSEVMSARTAFGVISNFSGYRTVRKPGDVRYYATSPKGRIKAWIGRNKATQNTSAIDRWKAMIPGAYGAGEGIPHQILGQPCIAAPPSICTQSFLFVCVDSREQAESVASYYRTRFLRFLVSLRKITQHTTRESYLWVPQQSWHRKWTDMALYKKYNLTGDEISFIESMIRPMEDGNGDD
jgi:site-specific DNA-methyltransferase (adenine-specific)